ncbi:MAG: hypothetical protein BGO67_11750 [Alphaproteobacteria bacterium 41-28]|nr:MAG: hypothetical protein BGO67_11750 [Alphaproteobacteria bacterium 41-28]
MQSIYYKIITTGFLEKEKGGGSPPFFRLSELFHVKQFLYWKEIASPCFAGFAMTSRGIVIARTPMKTGGQSNLIDPF